MATEDQAMPATEQQPGATAKAPEPLKKTEQEQEISAEEQQKREEELAQQLSMIAIAAENAAQDEQRQHSDAPPALLLLRQLVPALARTLAQGHYREDPVFSEVQALMEGYSGERGDWKRYEIWEDDPRKYSRNLIARKKGLFTLMLLCWPADVQSPVHDHGGSECWLRVVKGTLVEEFYELPDPEKPDAPLQLRFRKEHRAPAVCFINDQRGLHRIVNPSTEEPAITLHCYVPGYESCTAFLDEAHCDRGRKKCFLQFTSVNGRKVTH